MNTLPLVKKLNINTKPTVRTYTHHGFYNATITNSDRLSTNVANIVVSDFSNYKWNIQNADLTYTQDKNTLSFISNEWNTNMNICFWRECKDNDEIFIKISKQIYSNVWGAINLFITSEAQEDMLFDDKYEYRLGNFCKDGIYLRINNKDIDIPKFKCSFPIELKIVKKRNKITSYIKLNEENDERKINSWDIIKDDDHIRRIGFEVKLNNNAYNEWLYSNYIQINGDLNVSNIPIDYVCSPKKNWNPYQTNYFIDYNIEDKDMISGYGMSLLDFIKSNIYNNRYIEMWLNENIINNIKSENYFFHQNLIFGYNDTERVLNILNYNNGIPRETCIGYDDFESNRNKKPNKAFVIIYKYNPDYRLYEISPLYLSNVLRDYYESYDTNIRIQHLLMSDGEKKGIHLLNYLMTPIGLSKIKLDRRISYLIYERATIMKDRIRYLIHREIVTHDECDDIIFFIDKAQMLANTLLNITMKNLLNENSNYFERARNILSDIRECEMQYLPIFIALMESKVDTI